MKNVIIVGIVLFVLCWSAVFNLAIADAVNVDQDWINANRAGSAPHWTFEDDDVYTIIENVGVNGVLHLEAGTELILEGDVTFLGASSAAVTTPGTGDRISITADMCYIAFQDGCGTSNLERVDFLLNYGPITIGDCDGFTIDNCTIYPVDTWEDSDQYPGIQIYDNDTEYLISNTTFSEISLLIDCAIVEVYGCEFEFRETPLSILGDSEAVIRGFSKFTQTDNLSGYCIEIKPSNSRGWWTTPISTHIYDCEFTDNSEVGSSGIQITSFPTDTIQVYRCLFHKMSKGISITKDEHGANDEGILIRNNLFEDLDETGIDVDVSLDGPEGNIGIYNNIIHNIGTNGISISDLFPPIMRYNTISHVATCIYGEYAPYAWDNVFSDWSQYAVYSGNGGGGNVDYNVYCTPTNVTSADPPGIDYFNGIASPGGGPLDVLDEKDDGGDSWQYFPWGEENDDIDCEIYDASGAAPYDFHLIGTRDSYPSWANQNSDGDLEPDRPILEPGVFNAAARQLRTVQTFAADAGAYGGPLSEGFKISNEYGSCDFSDAYESMWGQYIEDPETEDASHFADPFIWLEADQAQWQYDGGNAPSEYFRVLGDMEIEYGDLRVIPVSVCIAFEDGNGMYCDGTLECNGDEDEEVELIGYGYNWDGLNFTSNADLSSCNVTYTAIRWGNYGICCDDVVDGSYRLEIEYCTFDSCDYGVYAEYSNIDVDNCTATCCEYGIKIYGTPSGSTTGCEVSNCTLTENDYGLTCTNQYLDMINCDVYDNDIRGVTISTCSAGKVYLSDVDSYLNGVGGDNNRLYSGIYLSAADAELIDCNVHDNGCNGVVCMSSSPDMDTYDTVARPNSIYSNGTGTQTGSTGAEFYLSLTSLPIVNYNNIYDVESSANVGAMMYRYLESTSAGYIIDAEHNYWGTVGVTGTDFSWTTMSPPWVFTDVFDIDPAETSLLSDVSNLDIAMSAWSAENYTQAASYFEDAIDDGGADALIAVRYLTGCYLKTEGNLDTLRAFYEDVEDESEEQLVQRTARRFMINCLTEMGDFEDAAEEYLDAAEDAYSYDDSIQCVIDYLTVCELGDIEPDGLDAFNRQTKLEELYLLLDSGNTEIDETIHAPQEFALTNAYPNPFNSTTTIAYSLPEQGDVKLSVFDLNGREVSVLHEGNVTAGNHTASWHANNLPSGLYWCRLESGSQIATMKLTLIK